MKVSQNDGTHPGSRMFSNFFSNIKLEQCQLVELQDPIHPSTDIDDSFNLYFPALTTKKLGKKTSLHRTVNGEGRGKKKWVIRPITRPQIERGTPAYMLASGIEKNLEEKI